MKGHREHGRDEAAAAASTSMTGGVPGKATLSHQLPAGTGLQLKSIAGARASAEAPSGQSFVDCIAGPFQRMAAPGAAADGGREAHIHQAAQEGVKSGGGAMPFMSQIQQSFGRHDIGGVSAHVGGDAAAASESVGAQAYAVGNHVAFKSSPDLHTAAHEAAHVIQQRGGVQLKGGIGEAGDAYEQHADAVADLVVQGKSAEGLLDTMAGGSGSTGVQKSAVQLLATYGGNWTTERYGPVAIGASRGADIKLVFEPTELVRSPKIALTQTITMNKGGTPYHMGEAEREDRANTAAEGDEGRHIDRLGERTSPLYGVNNNGAASSKAQFGRRVVGAGGAIDEQDAFLEDEPKLNWARGRPQAQTFETAALSVEGVQANTYYGTVSWGCHTDVDGNVALDPLRVVSMGAPTAEFMASAGHWNGQEVDVGGTATATDDLPITTHRTVDPASLNDAQLEERMRTLCNEVLTMDRTTPDYQNKRFEIRGLAREAVQRATAGGRPIDSGHTVTLAAGDTLWALAQRHLGGGPGWTRIFMLNYEELGDPNRVMTGDSLKMPQPYRPGTP